MIFYWSHGWQIVDFHHVQHRLFTPRFSWSRLIWFPKFDLIFINCQHHCTVITKTNTEFFQITKCGSTVVIIFVHFTDTAFLNHISYFQFTGIIKCRICIYILGAKLKFERQKAGPSIKLFDFAASLHFWYKSGDIAIAKLRHHHLKLTKNKRFNHFTICERLQIFVFC